MFNDGKCKNVPAKCKRAILSSSARSVVQVPPSNISLSRASSLIFFTCSGDTRIVQ